LSYIWVSNYETSGYKIRKDKLKNGSQIIMTVNIVPTISGDLKRKPLKDLANEHVQDIVKTVELAGIIPLECETSKVDFLVGNDYDLDLIHGDKIEVSPGLYLLAKLGWILSGKSDYKDESKEDANFLILTQGRNMTHSNILASVDKSLCTKSDIENMWSIESIRITDKCDKAADDIAMENFQETVEIVLFSD